MQQLLHVRHKYEKGFGSVVERNYRTKFIKFRMCVVQSMKGTLRHGFN